MVPIGSALDCAAPTVVHESIADQILKTEKTFIVWLLAKGPNFLSDCRLKSTVALNQSYERDTELTLVQMDIYQLGNYFGVEKRWIPEYHQNQGHRFCYLYVVI